MGIWDTLEDLGDKGADGARDLLNGDDGVSANPGPTVFGPHAPATVLDAAALAYAAYGYGGGDLAGQLQHLRQDRGALAPGWQALDAEALGLDAGLFTPDGYYEMDESTGFVAATADRVAIVFRGSDSLEDLKTAATNQQDYFADLKPMIQAAFAYAESAGISQVTITGHSLGAAMVQRTAAKMDEFAIPDGVQFTLVGFGSPGTDVENRTPLSRSILNIAHSGDPVVDLTDAGRTQHGYFTTIQLPNTEGADTLIDLAEQKAAQDADPSLITEHDMLRYLLSIEAVVESPLFAATDETATVIVLDAPDGAATDDGYRLDVGQSLLLGLDGDDTLIGGDAGDRIDGGAGFDWIVGGDGDDEIDGGSQYDTILAGAGDDTVRGGHGCDEVRLGAGDDVFEDTPQSHKWGNDSVYGEAGNDTIIGDGGDDFLSGGAGDDVLSGGPGNDTLQGYTGADTFVLAAGQGTDRIWGFAPGEDRIGLAGGLAYEDLAFSGSAILAGDAILATVNGVDATHLTVADFVADFVLA